MSPSNTLHAAVYDAPPIPFRLPNGKVGGNWSPISCTLLYTTKEAVLADTPITTAQTEDLAKWITATLPRGCRLRYIFVTHGHADHWFGIPTLQRRFPGVQPVANATTVAYMKTHYEQTFASLWNVQFLNQIDTPPTYATALPASGVFDVDGHELRAVEIGQADTHDCSVLWAPSLKLVVAGDAVYGDVHQMLGETNSRELRQAWIASVRKIMELKPEVVVPGHKKVGEATGPWHLERTIRYIEDFQKCVDQGFKGPRELSQAMLKIYPGRQNPGALIMGCMAAFKTKGNGSGNKL
ncbi:beta-lactamase-like protein [Phyllosticta capitalensis]|uniref:putative metallo-beta-lactamase domain protein n=1 Tax=Phyllosticta capitalensis TaxID=121624 RepID=UPI00312DDE00